MTTLARRLGGDRRGVAALEFAVLAPLLIVLVLAIIEAALLGWTQAALQLTATQTARCLGIGSTSCTNAQQYAVTLADNWLFANAVTPSGVIVVRNTICSTAPGHYTKVTIISQFTGATPLPGILGGGTLSAQACYYTGA